VDTPTGTPASILSTRIPMSPRLTGNMKGPLPSFALTLSARALLIAAKKLGRMIHDEGPRGDGASSTSPTMRATSDTSNVLPLVPAVQSCLVTMFMVGVSVTLLG